MRITHRHKKEEPKKAYRFNLGIVSPEVLVLDKTGANLGVMKTSAALALAQEQGIDLVEINPKSTPPVAKIIDFGQFRYTQEKEARIAKAHQHVVEIKGVRLSLRIGAHDLEIRKTQAMKFLNDGNKVKVEIILRGRENQQAGMAFEMIKKFVEDVNRAMPVRSEQAPEKQANKVTTIIAKS
ncbi:MAG: Translation initiation factor IF-3 [Candidatus Kaiserbacteria bacterium GW2011_GWA2_49_19]|uniref:Translation initiation factor IF-3 n=1 Tax=Candidatus Kaiserbacteria bacterium GW2011_GWA2_49_19 TaxID=1618669 RepID=A0A0G1Y042_9BACT|nr:MAG: Translation initiation factor IF-3 [Candidatus Kaiserbacteria bacterium GW2011_GWA2_49_19]